MLFHGMFVISLFPLYGLCWCYSIDGVNKIIVATSEGMLYMSSIDPKEGGEYRYKAFK